MSIEKTATTSDYLEQAKTRYMWLKPHYKNQQALYWPLGNTLSTMIDFLNLAVPAGNVTLTEAQSFLNTAADNYEKNGAWYDDWGWWGNATAKVFDEGYAHLFDGDLGLQKKFKSICQYCFDFMKNGDTSLKGPNSQGAPNAYSYVVEKANDPTDQNPSTWVNIKKDAEPVWNTGCWQNYMSPNCNPTDAIENHDEHSGAVLGPFQDTVVNALYYILTQRVLAPGYSEKSDIDMMTDYFNKWMGNSTPRLTPQEQIFNNLSSDPKAGLFRERISKFKDGTPVPGYREGNLAWTGDQGLMLSALTLLYKTNQDDDTLALIEATIQGVVRHAVDANNMILPWSDQSVPAQTGIAPGEDYGDYASGTGVFMRGLLHASSIPEVMTLIRTESMINNSLLVTTNQCLSPGYPYDGDTIFKHFNELATLTAASKLLSGIS
ncbi:hypothetical protein MSP8887_00620 [Marinomonas spartinae]|uniref:hypothetical protein n=1 Tax=Marinomonas spartinae TaxID=1792290 RepID=UPI00080900F8|nr:hypothetical protein [Marinomonas spartinae]SBS27353.1 hypothetical protein MSP8887_00620 [Marinomonas spartinae]